MFEVNFKILLKMLMMQKKIFDNNSNNPLKNKKKIKKIFIKSFKRIFNKNPLCLIISKTLNIIEFMKKIIFMEI